MGGNALKEFGAVRVSPEYYRAACKEVGEMLAKYDIDYTIPADIAGKEDFGDIDIVCVPPASGSEYERVTNMMTTLKNISVNEPKAGVIISNHNVYSMLWDNLLQIDLIFATTDTKEFYCNYLSFGDFGMILGRVARSLGYMFGHDGLWYKLPEGNKLLLTNDFTEALTVLGYNSDELKGLFSNIELPEEVVMDFLLSSDYIWQGVTEADSENRKSRKRDTHRPMFKRFLADFINNKKKYTATSPVWDPIRHAERKLNKEPDTFYKQVDDAYNYVYVRDRANKKFSGGDISKITGLEGKELGNFIQYYKDEFIDNKSYFEFVNYHTVERLHEDVLDVFDEYKQDMKVNPEYDDV
jgi:hypothetical protein